MRISQSVDVDAPADVVWDIVGPRFADVSAWASAVRRSQPAGDAGRACTVAATGFDSITETVVAYDDDARALTYRAASGMPSFVSEALSTWRVTPLAPRRSRVTISADLRLRGLARLLAPAVVVYFRRLGRATLDDLRVYAETGRPSARKLRTSDEPLRLVVRANAVFSVASGTLLAAAAGPLASHLGQVPPAVLTGVGVSVVAYGAGLALLARRPLRPATGLVLAALDAVWVAGTALILPWWGDRFTLGGALLMTAIAAVVAGFAVLEWRLASGSADRVAAVQP